MAASTPAGRLRIALDLADLGQQMVRSRRRRKHPDWTESDLDVAIAARRRDRPGAPIAAHPGPRSTRWIIDENGDLVRRW